MNIDETFENFKKQNDRDLLIVSQYYDGTLNGVHFPSRRDLFTSTFDTIEFIDNERKCISVPFNVWYRDIGRGVPESIYTLLAPNLLFNDGNDLCNVGTVIYDLRLLASLNVVNNVTSFIAYYRNLQNSNDEKVLQRAVFFAAVIDKYLKNEDISNDYRFQLSFEIGDFYYNLISQTCSTQRLHKVLKILDESIHEMFYSRNMIKSYYEVIDDEYKERFHQLNQDIFNKIINNMWVT